MRKFVLPFQVFVIECDQKLRFVAKEESFRQAIKRNNNI